MCKIRSTILVYYYQLLFHIIELYTIFCRLCLSTKKFYVKFTKSELEICKIIELCWSMVDFIRHKFESYIKKSLKVIGILTHCYILRRLTARKNSTNIHCGYRELNFLNVIYSKDLLKNQNGTSRLSKL